MVDDMYETLHLLILADLQRSFLNANEREIRQRLTARFSSRSQIIAAYGWDPKTEGYPFFETS